MKIDEGREEARGRERKRFSTQEDCRDVISNDPSFKEAGT